MTRIYFDQPLTGPEMIDGRYCYTTGEAVPEPVRTLPLSPAQPDDTLTDYERDHTWVTSTGGVVEGRRITGLDAVIEIPHGKVAASAVFRNLSLDNCGPILSLPGGRVEHLIVEKVRATNVRPLTQLLQFYGLPRGGFEADISDLTVVYRNEVPGLNSAIPTALAAGNKNQNNPIERVTVNRVYIEGAISNPNNSFPNGDGLTCETEVKLFEVFDLATVRITDASIDSKAKLTRLVRHHSDRSRYGIKVWGNLEGQHSLIERPWVSHVLVDPLSVHDNQAIVTFDGLICADPSKPAFTLGSGRVRINATGKYEGAELVRKQKDTILLPDSTWNGSLIT